MAPRTQIVTLNDVVSKGMTISAIGGTVPSPIIDRPHSIEDTGSSLPHEAAANIQAPPPQYED